MLDVRDAVVRYGAIEALKGVSLEVKRGEIVCLIGANGAGKSTVLNAISGVVPVASGAISFEGTALRGLRASAIVRSGVVQVPEGRLVFPDMTVRENLEMGAFRSHGSLDAEWKTVFELFPRLAERQAQLAGLMSGGEQQMLAIARALMARPRLLLLDEPSMGLAPLAVAEIFRTLGRLRSAFGQSILIVEQNANAALRLADRGYVLTTGRVSLEGPAATLLADTAVREAFLGRMASGPANPASNPLTTPQLTPRG